MTPAPRIVTVTLNASIDQTARIANFTTGTVNRAALKQSDAGGKGINVASCLADFGYMIAVTGVLGTDNQQLFLRLFAEKGLTDRFVRVPGHTRENVKVVDNARHQVTDINFPGITVSPEDIDAVCTEIEALADDGAEVFVLSGSLPAGAAATTYCDIAAHLKDRRRRVVLDTSGDALAHAITATPDVIKPNIDELSELVGRPLTDEPSIVAAARDLIVRGIELVAVSMGGCGAIFVTADAAIHALPPPVQVRSTVGAGDAMVAGIIHADLQHLDIEERARLASAFALGALGEIGPRLPPREVIEAICDQVTTRRIAA